MRRKSTMGLLLGMYVDDPKKNNDILSRLIAYSANGQNWMEMKL